MASEKDTSKVTSDDGVSFAAGTVVPEGGTKVEIDPKKAKKDKSVKGIDEALSELIGGMEGVSEDFKRQLTSIFEGAVEVKAKALAEEAREAAQTELEEAKAAIATELEEAKTSISEGFDAKIQSISEQFESESETILEGVSNFLDYVAERFMEENALAIESSLAVERATRIAESVANIAAIAGLDLSEESVSLHAELEEKNERLSEDYNKIVLENVSLKEAIRLNERKEIIAEISEDLTESQKDQLSNLTSMLSFANVDTFRSDVTAIKEGMFKVAPKGKDIIESQEISGSVKSDEAIVENAGTENEVDMIVNAIRRLNGK